MDLGFAAKAAKMLELSFFRVGGLLVVAVVFFEVLASDLVLVVRLRVGLVTGSGVGAFVVVFAGAAAAAGFDTGGGGGGRAPVRRCSGC